MTLGTTSAPENPSPVQDQRIRRAFERAVFCFSTKDTPSWFSYCSMREAEALGALVLPPAQGIPDLALARSIGLTQAYDLSRSTMDQPVPRSIIVTFDDDIAWAPSSAAFLIERALLDGLPHMACYISADGVLMAAPSPQHNYLQNGTPKTMWMGGLGLCAIPLHTLERVATTYALHKRVRYKDGAPPVIAFCRTGPMHVPVSNRLLNEEWWAMDDRCLMARMGGAVIEPEVVVAHEKKRPYHPSVEQCMEWVNRATLEALAINQPKP